MGNKEGGRSNSATFGLRFERKKHAGCFVEWLGVAKEQNQILEMWGEGMFRVGKKKGMGE